MTEPINNMHLHSNLRTIRQHTGLSQEQLARIIGTSRTNYNHYERDTAPPLAMLIHISDTLHVSLDQLIRTDMSRLGSLKLRQVLYSFMNRQIL